MSTTNIQARKHWLSKRLPFYYGWVIVPISILGTLSTSPGQTFMVSVFNPSFRETLNLSLSQLTGAYMAGTILAAVPQSYVGVWMDRLGIRRMLILVVSIFGLACIFISQVQNLFTLFLAFFCLRMFGQGALELLSSNMLAMWFRERLGTISAVSGVAVSLLIGLVPVIALNGINRFGWRSTYIVAGVTIWLVMLPVAIFFYISKPEEIGQEVDGGIEIRDKDKSNDQVPEVSLTLRETMRTRSYWTITGGIATWAAVITGITFNLLPIFTAKGLTEEQAAATFTIVMFVSAGTRLLGGYLADRIPLYWLSVGGLGFFAAAVGALLILPSGWLVAGYVSLLGLAQGLLNGLFTTVWVRYYGREHLGKIRGTVWTATVAGSSIGPFIMGLVYDHYGNFNLALIGCIVVMVGLAVASFWATPPKPQVQAA
jgi:MFS family permease